MIDLQRSDILSQGNLEKLGLFGGFDDVFFENIIDCSKKAQLTPTEGQLSHFRKMHDLSISDPQSMVFNSMAIAGKQRLHKCWALSMHLLEIAAKNEGYELVQKFSYEDSDLTYVSSGTPFRSPDYTCNQIDLGTHLITDGQSMAFSKMREHGVIYPTTEIPNFIVKHPKVISAMGKTFPSLLASGVTVKVNSDCKNFSPLFYTENNKLIVKAVSQHAPLTNYSYPVYLKEFLEKVG